MKQNTQRCVEEFLTLTVYIQDMASTGFDSVFDKKTQDVEEEKRETTRGRRGTNRKVKEGDDYGTNIMK